MVWAKIYRTEFLQKHDIRFEKGIPGEDQVFTVWCYLTAQKVRYVKHCVYHYVVRNEQGNTSLSNNRNKKYFDGILKCCEKCKALFQKYNAWHAGKKFVGNLLGDQLMYAQTSDMLDRAEKIAVLEAMRALNDEGGEGVFGRIFIELRDPEKTLGIFEQLVPVYKEKNSVLHYAKFLQKERERILNDLEIYKDWVSNQEKTIEILHQDVQVYKTDSESKQKLLQAKDAEMDALKAAVAQKEKDILNLQQQLHWGQAYIGRIKLFCRKVRRKLKKGE